MSVCATGVFATEMSPQDNYAKKTSQMLGDGWFIMSHAIYTCFLWIMLKQRISGIAPPVAQHKMLHSASSPEALP